MRSRRNLWISLSVVLLLFLLACGALIAVQYQPAIAANFADTVLRPVLGDTLTIKLEGLLFKGKDRIDRIRYHSEPPPATSYEAPALANMVHLPGKTIPLASTPLLSLLKNITLNPNAFPPLPDEGKWKAVQSSASPGSPVLARTFVRPDSTRSYAIVNLVAMDMTKLSLAAVAGTQHPGGELNLPGPGKIPQNIQDTGKLVAAFNGGFQEKDGHYGMIVGSTTYVPLKKGLATLIIPTSRPLRMEVYGGEPLTDVAAVRQNGLLLVKDGQRQDRALAGDQLWAGATITGDFITWRSGIGIRPDGTLIYAVGPSLSVGALADALQAAGATNAMELDINDFWVRFVLYNQKPDGSYAHSALVQEMHDGGAEYINNYQKDFFYVYWTQL